MDSARPLDVLSDIYRESSIVVTQSDHQPDELAASTVDISTTVPLAARQVPEMGFTENEIIQQVAKHTGLVTEPLGFNLLLPFPRFASSIRFFENPKCTRPEPFAWFCRYCNSRETKLTHCITCVC